VAGGVSESDESLLTTAAIETGSFEGFTEVKSKPANGLIPVVVLGDLNGSIESVRSGTDFAELGSRS
jgi:hypothetical protein